MHLMKELANYKNTFFELFNSKPKLSDYTYTVYL